MSARDGVSRYESVYPWIEPLDLGHYPNCTVYGPPTEVPICRNTLDESLEHPLGSDSLGALVERRKAKKVLVIVDDISRPTPQKEMLARILPVFEEHGIPRRNLTILVALGLHRAMTRGECENRYGSEVASNYTIVNHDACDEGTLVSIGTTRAGVDVTVNRLLTEADFILGLGQIAPHRVVGFSGGAKIVMPGVCGKRIVSQLHWQGWTTNSRDIFAVPNNPVRDEINAIGDLAKLDFVVNVVMEGTEVIRYYSGNHLEVFRQASGDILRAYSVPIPPSDVVVVEAYPYDLDMQQAAKAVCTGELVVKPGGTVILLSSCPDGWHVNFPELLKTGYLPYSQVVERVGRNQMDQAIGCHLAAFGRVLQTGRVCVVSNHLRKEDIQRMNLVPASSLREALERELQRFGRDASISIIRESAKIIPV